MYHGELLPAAEWAHREFSGADFGDARLTKRAAVIAEDAARNSAGSIPDQATCWSRAKGAYRFLANKKTTFDKVLEGHRKVTMDAMRQQPRVFLVQDTTEVTVQTGTEQLGPVGPNFVHGFQLHNVLAMTPGGELLGLRLQIFHCRKSAPKNESRHRRQQRDRESLLWSKAIARTGRPEPGQQYVHICDRGADAYTTFAAAKETGVNLIVRACADRMARLDHVEGEATGKSQQMLRALPPQGRRELPVRAGKEHELEMANLEVAFSPITIRAPRRLLDQKDQSLQLWAVRVWSTRPLPGGKPLEWVLLANYPVRSIQEANAVADAYSLRWKIEEFHKGLKTGFALEKRLVETRSSWESLAGIGSAVAFRLLSLRDQARVEPNRKACEVVERLVLETLKTHRNLPVPVSQMTLEYFLRSVAMLGGFLGRKGDGKPGWITLWRGFNKLDLLVAGARIEQRRRRSRSSSGNSSGEGCG